LVSCVNTEGAGTEASEGSTDKQNRCIVNRTPHTAFCMLHFTLRPKLSTASEWPGAGLKNGRTPDVPNCQVACNGWPFLHLGQIDIFCDKACCQHYHLSAGRYEGLVRNCHNHLFLFGIAVPFDSAAKEIAPVLRLLAGNRGKMWIHQVASGPNNP